MGRKANPEASYIEIEKSFYENKGQIVEREEVPFDVEKKSTSTSSDGLNLVRPVPKKGIKFETDVKPPASEIKRPTVSGEKAMDSARKSKLPNVILRKPTVVNEDDVEDRPSRFRMKSNLSLRMRNEKAKEQFTDMTLLRKPEPMSVDTSIDEKQDSGDIVGVEKEKEVEDEIVDFTLLKKPEQVSGSTKVGEEVEQFQDLEVEAERFEAEIEANMLASATKSSVEEALKAGHGSIPKKPQIEDHSLVGNAPCYFMKILFFYFYCVKFYFGGFLTTPYLGRLETL